VAAALNYSSASPKHPSPEYKTAAQISLRRPLPVPSYAPGARIVEVCQQGVSAHREGDLKVYHEDYKRVWAGIVSILSLDIAR